MSEHQADDATGSDPATANPIALDWPSSAMSVVSLCPNCDAVGSCGVVLMARTTFPGRAKLTKLLRCTACTCLFFDPLPELDYGADTDLAGAVLAFYIQQAAGIAHMVHSLARIDRPACTQLLDVGCGFGFGLDYALGSRGWVGRGIDPSPLARTGAVQLGVPIAHRLLEAADAAMPADVVMAAEVLEHLATPANFLALARSVLRQDGILVMSTPNADSVRRDAPESTLIPILSVGAHSVLQTARSLTALLQQAGFHHVYIRDAGFSLTAYASAEPFTLRLDEPILHAAYRDYLRSRALLSPPDSDLALGYAARALDEALADHDWDEVDRQFALLETAILQRFGARLTQTQWPDLLLAIRSPVEWAEVAPFCLPSLLHAKALQRLIQAEDVVGAVPLFAAANAVARLLRPVLREMNADDQAVQAIETFDVGGMAAAALTVLVNRGNVSAALDLVRQYPQACAEPPDGSLDAAGRDLVFALAMLELSEPTAPDRAARLFGRVQEATSADPTSPLHLAAVQGGLQAAAYASDSDAVERLHRTLAGTPGRSGWPTELRRMHDIFSGTALVRAVNAGRLAEARDIMSTYAPDGFVASAEAPLDNAQRDVLFAAAMLALQDGGDAALAARYFARLRDELKASEPLFLAALQGELQAAAKLGDDARADRLHQLLAASGSHPWPAELQRMHQAHAAASLVRAVNAGSLADARDMLARLPPELLDRAAAPARDVMFAAAMLDLQLDGNPARAARRFAQVREGLPATDQLSLAALQGELQAADAMRDRTALTRLHLVVGSIDPAARGAELARLHARFTRRESGLLGRLRRAPAAMSADAKLSRPQDRS